MRLDALTTVKGYLQNATFNHTSVTVNIVDLRMNLNRTCPLLTDFSFMFAGVLTSIRLMKFLLQTICLLALILPVCLKVVQV